MVDADDTQSKTDNKVKQGQLLNNLDAWINCIIGEDNFIHTSNN